MNKPQKIILRRIKVLLKTFFPETNVKFLETKLFSKILNLAFDRTEFCLSKIKLKYYNLKVKDKPVFNHLNTDHICTFLYFLANTAYNEKIEKKFIEKFFYLNKILHSIDLFYEVEMPDIFLFSHPLGSVIGKAKYKNYLVIHQNVTVGGGDEKNIYPSIGEGAVLYSNSSILGDSSLGQNVILGANSSIINKKIDQNKIVIGLYPENKILENKKDNVSNNFHI